MTPPNEPRHFGVALLHRAPWRQPLYLCNNFSGREVGTEYASLWNAFKLIAASASADEKLELFSGTARRVYRRPDA